MNKKFYSILTLSSFLLSSCSIQNHEYKASKIIAEIKSKNGLESNQFKIDKEKIPVDQGSYTVKSKNKFEFKKIKKTNDNGIAVIIGNRDYWNNRSNIPNVDYALNDAAAIKEFVLKGLGFREGNILYINNATQAELIGTFGFTGNPQGKLYDWVLPEESDVFVFYSGHGAPSLKSGQGYLLPVDADPQRIDLTGYSLETLYTNLGKIPGKSLTVIIDACFSGSSNNATIIRNASAISLRRVETQKVLPKATILTAAGMNEVASWDTENQYGLFTRYFLEGVAGAADTGRFGNGDSQITLEELKQYLESEVTYSARRNYGREQHPQVIGNKNSVIAILDNQ